MIIDDIVKLNTESGVWLKYREELENLKSLYLYSEENEKDEVMAKICECNRLLTDLEREMYLTIDKLHVLHHRN